MIWLKRLLMLAVGAALAAALVYAFLPQPVEVSVEIVKADAMEVAVRDDGQTRIRERYVISTPIAGRLQRIDLEVGDSVVAGVTRTASIEPTSPALLDSRAQAQAKARVRAAQGRLELTDTELAKAKAQLNRDQAHLNRQLGLMEKNAVTPADVEDAQLAVRTAVEAIKAAEYSQEIAKYELELEQAGLLHVTTAPSGDPESTELRSLEFVIPAPISGRVLRVMQESSAVVAAGAPLLEIGDPLDLEVVVDILSSDAVRVRTGQQVWLEQWGGGDPLPGVVRLVEPSGFTKISALGVEEQRVNVIIDFAQPLTENMALGDGYRVEARIVVWESPSTISVPTGALFRDKERWAVFVVQEGKVYLRHVSIGENNGFRAQVLDGLKEGERVVLHPSDQLEEGIEVVVEGELEER